MSIFKITMIAFTLAIAILIPELLQVKRWIYGIVFLIGYIYLLIKLFSKK
ncbi:MAG: hypothetical protein GXP45_01675 [bacterium]|nr:hypothetical protein [bacterium]